MEDNKSALDLFMNFQSESVSSQVSSGGPSYLALIKSRYAANGNVDATVNVEKYEVSVAFEAWQEDFMHSNNIVLDHEHSHEHCAHGHDHTASDVNIEELDDELENITLVSSPHNVSTISSQLRMSNRLKVDNFYIDGESEPLEDMDLFGYLPSGLNSSTLIEDQASDSEGSDDLDIPTQDDVDVHVLELYETKAPEVHDADGVDGAEDSGDISRGTLTLHESHTYTDDDLENHTHAELNTTNMAVLQRAYQAEQHRAIETLSCSESSSQHSEHEHHSDEDDVDIGHAGEIPNMSEALAEFQKYSARYRDIDSGALLHIIQTQNSTGSDGVHHSTASEDYEVGSRWYDDVEEFVEEP